MPLDPASENDWLFNLNNQLLKHFDNFEAFSVACIDTGMKALRLSTGILSRIDKADYEIIQAKSEIKELHNGAHLSLTDTYCNATLQEEALLAYHHIGDMPNLRDQPIYSNSGIEVYIGAPVRVDGQIYGTLSFTDKTPRAKPFTTHEAQLVEMMANLIGRLLERHKFETVLIERERMFEQSFQHGLIGKAICKPSGEIVDVNPALCALFGYNYHQMIGYTAADFTHPDDLDLTDSLYRELFLGKRDHFILEKRYLHQSGRELPTQVGVSLVRETSGSPIYLIIQIIDLTERNRVQAELQATNENLKQLATTDSLTGLLNRRAMDDVLVREFARAKRNQSPLSLILLDLDHFKYINDHYGHPTGDSVLAHLGFVLLETVRKSDIAARMGGEEFAILLPDTSLTETQTLAERIQHALHLASWPVNKVTASFGLSELSTEAESTTTLFTDADHALYSAKAAGRDCIVAPSNKHSKKSQSYSGSPSCM
ncbi:sensor domain-containing diguanylate cyclase [Acidihalobacter prosperus]